MGKKKKLQYNSKSEVGSNVGSNVGSKVGSNVGSNSNNTFDRVVTEEEMNEIIIPYLRVRFTSGLVSLFVFLGILMLILFCAVYFSGEDHALSILLYGGVFLLALLLFM